MSSLGPLFIPRKDNLPVPKSSDNPDLTRYLEQMSQRIHTNELAIQRWANSVPRLAAVMGTGSTVTALSTGPTVQMKLDGTVNSYFPNVVTSNTLVIPAGGWYTISATALWNAGTIATQNAGGAEVYIYKNGITTPGTEIGASGTFPQIINTAPLITVGLDYMPLTLTTLFNKKDAVQFNAFNSIFTSTGGGTSVTAKFVACTLDFLGPSPTAVQ